MLFGIGVAMRLRTMQAGPAMQMPAFLLLFLAPVWVPYDLLTGWVAGRGRVQPDDRWCSRPAAASSRATRRKVLPAFAVGGGCSRP